MIASIASPQPIASTYLGFLRALEKAGFAGEISSTHADRVVLATDNSIYQRLPQAVVFPRDADDVQRLARLAAEPAWQRIVLTPRGGGTGTNGQSLTDGIVVDLSRHMNGILSIDARARRVRVQTGVVKDQLNKALQPHGLFFAPELSTSNRATLGGMINTDASGQGSCTYGKTRDHVVSLDCVLLGGERFESFALEEDELREALQRPGRIGDAYRCAADIAQTQGALIEAHFPKLNRCLTGYDLAHLREPDGRFNLNSVLCGAEGSLGFIVEAELAVLAIPTYSVLVNVRYASFMDALSDARALMAHRPLSIETVDSRVLQLAMQDMVWTRVKEYFPQAQGEAAALGINLVEFSGDDIAQVDARVEAFALHLQTDLSVERLGHTIAAGHDAVERVYQMRKRAVGLLGNVQGEVRPQPFVEDTAVPPERLPEYIAEFRALLDGLGLAYGMFGHVDAGVLHVRPALDLKDPAQAALVRTVSDAVADLTQKYGGLLWGEHGKGVRSEYVPKFFGPLYPALQQLKAAFDPHNQLNPGKIATPASRPGDQLLRIDGVPMRGDSDRQIDERVWQSFGTAMHCNGNGACYNFDPDDAMCPSWKGTRERRHSPKGRASLMREWLRLQGAAGADVMTAPRGVAAFVTGLPGRWRNTRSQHRDASPDFSHEVYEAMAGCLACKSCAGQCPVKVSVPEFRSRFLQLYHARYLRPLKDYLIGSLEFTIPYLARMPRLYNAIMSAPVVTRALDRIAGMVDSPLLSRFDIERTLQRLQVRTATPELLASLTPAQRAKSVILVQDAFTRWFETPVWAAFVELAARTGHTAYIAPFRPNGKPLHVQGFLHSFERAAERQTALLRALAASGIPLVGLDPAMTLVYRQEYLKIASAQDCPQVLLPQEWLLQAMPEQNAARAQQYRLLAHCTEKTNVPASVSQWTAVFARAGLTLTPMESGCCGMSGTYGHESRNVATSKIIFGQSWGPLLSATSGAAPAEILATGYSCRSQAARLQDRTLRHPVQVLLEHLAPRPISGES
ncbi:FAD-binding and (Fe-S)-binding domain-containing protein [Caenimonas sp. SL110]|uniref:D-2-hydroxyglutarate dehydrogenase YdiJ n=1 Tax=Caenimonas sp. SL110 TaxID=1450524 RepID=UPI000652D686|nr:FAD-binding and (Fe-S)-binding domain-containing protein [Caenimonas sp. SL110]